VVLQISAIIHGDLSKHSRPERFGYGGSAANRSG
jgi:hypothetical protein